MADNNFTIKPYHWWLTISVAIVLHVFLLINYKQENVHTHNHADNVQNEIIIGLKKLKPAPSIEKPNIIKTIEPSPVKPKPVLKKQKIVKAKKNPVIKSKPLITKPAVAPAIVATRNITSKQNNTTNSQSIKLQSSLNADNTSITTENERALYYAKLAQWLERHKKYPTIARRRNQQGDVTIQFVMNKQGELLRYQLMTPSEHHSLNTATIKMLERASPMPTPPKELVGDKTELEFTIPVRFNLVN